MGIRLLGALQLPRAAPDGTQITELSALAWDEAEQLLYAVSDEGRLYHLRPQFSGGVLSGLEFVRAYALRDAAGKPLRGRHKDAEGALLRSTSPARKRARRRELVISFEVKPRLARYATDGTLLGEVRLPPPLDDIRRYTDRNRALEAVAWHPRWGLLTISERPLRNGSYPLVAVEARTGAHWDYRPGPAAASAVVALEVLPDGSALALERSAVSLLEPVVISLRRTPPLQRPLSSGQKLNIETVAELNSWNGWLVDNFEGLARHSASRFFMVSDDNGSLLQRTLLVYFEVL
jgi:hypothetical protein